MKRLLLLLFLMLAWPTHGWAACVPTTAKPGMIGCEPVAASVAGTDYIQAWLPDQPLSSAAQIIQVSNLFSSLGGPYLPLSGGTVSGGLGVLGNLTIGGTISGAGVTSLFASPTPIGSIAPNSGAFTNVSLSGTLGLGSSTIRWGILPVAAGAPTSAGSGYVVGDVITLTGGATVSVISVSGGGVTEFYVQQSGSYTTVPTGAIAQISTTGIGTGFTVTPVFGPIAASIGAASLSPGLGNFILGYQAGSRITTGNEATLVGDYAGLLMTTGNQNTAFGHRALGSETTGNNNTVLGNDAMRDTVGVGASVAIGNSAVRDWSGCSFCVGIGVQALAGKADGTSTGSSNIAIGYQAFYGLAATTAIANIGIGNNVAPSLTSANSSVFVGDSAANHVTTADKNVFVGAGSGFTDVTGFQNTYVGYHSGTLATGSNNTLIGDETGAAMTTAASNAVFGHTAGNKLTTGGSNLILGPQVASTTLTTGAHNILIGVSSLTDTSTAGANDVLIIQGNGTSATLSCTAMSSTPLCSFPGGSLTLGVASTTGATLVLEGATSGAITLQPSAIAGSNTVTLPAATGTVGLVMAGTTGSIGGGALAAGECASGTATVAGVSTSMALSTTPAANPQVDATHGLSIWAYRSGANTVTVQVCAIVSTTPVAVAYNVRAIQ